jgi:hypothetical protein
MQITLIESDTDPLEFDIKRAPTPGATPATFNAAGMTIAATIKAKDGTVVDTTGAKVEWSDQANSRAKFNRAAGDFLRAKSPYYWHWTVTDGNGKDASWPEGRGIEVIVIARGQG